MFYTRYNLICLIFFGVNKTKNHWIRPEISFGVGHILKSIVFLRSWEILLI